MDLTNKTVLVTGGASGIGLGIARALAREGCRVAICGRSRKRLEDAAASLDGGPPILAHPCDVSDRSSVEQLIAWATKQLGPLEIVVNSAGVNIVKREMHRLDPADFDRIMAINCTGLFNIMHAVLPGMRRRKDGLIVNISSIAGKRAMPLAGTAYAASKFAATALGTEVGLEEQRNGIRITNIYPGETHTPMIDQRPDPIPDEKRAKMVQPEDIGALVVAIAKLPPHVVVPELVVKPLYQEYM